MKIFRLGETLTDQLGADNAIAILDQTAVCLVEEDRLGDPGDSQRVEEARDHGEQKQDSDRGANGVLDISAHEDFLQARLRPVTRRSISLMPMNGAVMPPMP